MNFDLKINDFIEKIKNIIKGNQLNFYISNDEFYEYILEFFGDKEFIVKNYRDIINSLKNEDFFSFYYFTEKIYFYFCKNYLLCLEINQYNCHKFKNQIYTGINIMILLLELNRYIRKVNKVDRKITFYPSGNPKIQKEENKLNILSYLINSLNYIDSNNFVKIIDNHLSGAILTNAD
ncbi:MAG: hypothetical protein ACFBSE_17310 [Prochloraceae cyanobacterium]